MDNNFTKVLLPLKGIAGGGIRTRPYTSRGIIKNPVDRGYMPALYI
jgi:hypothetical protein